MIGPLDCIIATPDMDIPVEAFPFYIATQKGWLVHTPTLFGSARVISKESPASLPELKEQFLLNGKRLPAFILSQFHDFARKNFDKNKAECSAYITYHHHLERFRLFIPEQYVSHVSVNHKLDAGAINRGYVAIGTIHSHCDFSAFHSGTDKHDMGKMPGLHITAGFVTRDDPEYVFALSVGNAQFDVTREQIIDEALPLDHNGYATAPDRWLGFVHTGTAPWTNGVTTSFKPKVSTFPPKTPYRQWNQQDWGSDDFLSGSGWHYPAQRAQRPLTLVEQQSLNLDAFEEFADYIQDSERILQDEAAELAFLGFHLNYNITFNPDRAKGFLVAHNLDQLIDEDDFPLLPERTTASDD